jgi:hypothetical protein
MMLPTAIGAGDPADILVCRPLSSSFVESAQDGIGPLATGRSSCCQLSIAGAIGVTFAGIGGKCAWRSRRPREWRQPREYGGARPRSSPAGIALPARRPISC